MVFELATAVFTVTCSVLPLDSVSDPHLDADPHPGLHQAPIWSGSMGQISIQEKCSSRFATNFSPMLRQISRKIKEHHFVFLFVIFLFLLLMFHCRHQFYFWVFYILEPDLGSLAKCGSMRVRLNTPGSFVTESGGLLLVCSNLRLWDSWVLSWAFHPGWTGGRCAQQTRPSPKQSSFKYNKSGYNIKK